MEQYLTYFLFRYNDQNFLRATSSSTFNEMSFSYTIVCLLAPLKFPSASYENQQCHDPSWSSTSLSMIRSIDAPKWVRSTTVTMVIVNIERSVAVSQELDKRYRGTNDDGTYWY